MSRTCHSCAPNILIFSSLSPIDYDNFVQFKTYYKKYYFRLFNQEESQLNQSYVAGLSDDVHRKLYF